MTVRYTEQQFTMQMSSLEPYAHRTNEGCGYEVFRYGSVFIELVKPHGTITDGLSMNN